ncbi:MAG: iron-siderophore ABC transporter substrate-binding protein [Propionicimonas sp.]|uniref:iron-siderophore ABC transporter substrate-binding protein n=1 Tax=Propionicimonas sp. TaxID=1955623 RepID=UPI003D106DD9
MPGTTRRRLLASIAGLGLAASLAACTSPASETASTPAASASASAAAFPVTITSALGDAVIESKPERVATWGWSSQDAVLALGIVPVAMPAYTYGGTDGVLPWDADAIKALGGTTPTLLKGGENGEVNVEEFVAAKPDVILAPYSGLTQEEFDSLSKIAPVVAYPDQPWATSWQDQATIVGKALGLEAEAEQLVSDANDKVAALASAHPELKGKTFVYGANNEAEVFNIYRASDPRVQLLVELGMEVAPSVAELDPKPADETYFYGLSFEKLSKLDSDVLVAYFGSQDEADAFAKDPLVAAMPQVKEGRFAPIVGESFVMASSAPTVLSIPWMLDAYVPQLAAAAAKSDG